MWIPPLVFIIQFVVNAIYLLKAIKSEELADQQPAEPAFATGKDGAIQP